MYDTKEQILTEIRRIAKTLKVKNLKKSDFLKKTMIPVNTIDFYISSWSDALAEAGLEDDSSVKISSVTDKELLTDLLRLEKEFGEIPTFSRIEGDGKFSKKDYQLKWRSIEDAIKIARKKYSKNEIETPDKTIMMKPVKKEQEKPDSALIDLEETMVSRNREDLGIEDAKKKDKFSESELDFTNVLGTSNNKEHEDVEPEFIYSTDDAGIEDILSMDIQKPKKKKIIPETIKPKVKKKEKKKQETINFRGIKTAPVDVEGVIFIFGMICEELSFIIEAFNTEMPCFEGKRRLDGSGKKIQDVKIGVYHKSYDLKTKSGSVTDCDIIVCWEHDWNDCPVEVLELKAVLKKLDPN